MAIRNPILVKSITNTATSGTTNYDFFIPQDTDSVTVKLYTGTFTGTNPTLDVYVQTTDDGGVTWYDLGHFAQLVADVTKQNANWMTFSTNTAFIAPSVSGASTLGAGKAAPVPILSTLMRVAVIVGGTLVANAGTEVRVYSASQARGQ